MNTVEHIVDCYFQLVRGCFTRADVKVPGGNNRQFDILAANIVDGASYHVEASVTHELNWCPTPEQLRTSFRQKFFGVPRPKEGANTDHAKGKSYLPKIRAAYASLGLDYQSLRRVWCCWVVRDGVPHEVEEQLVKICTEFGVKSPVCEVLSLRDQVMPELTDAIGRSNYDDDVLRMMSLLEQRRAQLEG